MVAFLWPGTGKRAKKNLDSYQVEKKKGKGNILSLFLRMAVRSEIWPCCLRACNLWVCCSLLDREQNRAWSDFKQRRQKNRDDFFLIVNFREKRCFMNLSKETKKKYKKNIYLIKRGVSHQLLWSKEANYKREEEGKCWLPFFVCFLSSDPSIHLSIYIYGLLWPP